MLLLATNRTAKVLWHFRIRIWPGSVANVFSELHVNQLQQERLTPRHGKDLKHHLAQPLWNGMRQLLPGARQDKLWYKVIEIIHQYTLNSQLCASKVVKARAIPTISKGLKKQITLLVCLFFSMAYFYDSMCISKSEKKKVLETKPAKRPGRTQYLRSQIIAWILNICLIHQRNEAQKCPK